MYFHAYTVLFRFNCDLVGFSYEKQDIHNHNSPCGIPNHLQQNQDNDHSLRVNKTKTYPLVTTSLLWKDASFFIGKLGKLTISTAIFNSYD